MLIPNKHTDLSRNVLVVAADILEYLAKHRVVNFDDLRNYIRKKIPGADRNFIPALTLLYALNVIEYRKKNDSFEYIGSK